MSQNVYPSKTTLTLNKLVQDFIYNNFGSNTDRNFVTDYLQVVMHQVLVVKI